MTDEKSPLTYESPSLLPAQETRSMECDLHCRISLMSYIIKISLKLVMARMRNKLQEDIADLWKANGKSQITRRRISGLAYMNDFIQHFTIALE